MRSNHILSLWALHALQSYGRISGDGFTLEGVLPMLLASLHHLADREGWSWEAATTKAARTYQAERED